LIQVYDSTGTQLLYSYTYNGGPSAYFPTPISSGLMNTGNLVFQQHPVFINFNTDQSVIY
jgi:hypothetical protein